MNPRAICSVSCFTGPMVVSRLTSKHSGPYLFCLIAPSTVVQRYYLLRGDPVISLNIKSPMTLRSAAAYWLNHSGHRSYTAEGDCSVASHCCLFDYRVEVITRGPSTRHEQQACYLTHCQLYERRHGMWGRDIPCVEKQGTDLLR